MDLISQGPELQGTYQGVGPTMPLYIVRWPDLTCHLIQAENTSELFWTLDIMGDPTECKYQIYTGPVCIRLELPFFLQEQEGAEPSPVDHTVAKLLPKKHVPFDEDEFRAEPTADQLIHASLEPDFEVEGDGMAEALLALAFPHTGSFLEEEQAVRDAEEDGEDPPVERMSTTLHAAIEVDEDTSDELEFHGWEDMCEVTEQAYAYLTRPREDAAADSDSLT